jgi:hypothetical protein
MRGRCGAVRRSSRTMRGRCGAVRWAARTMRGRWGAMRGTGRTVRCHGWTMRRVDRRDCGHGPSGGWAQQAKGTDQADRQDTDLLERPTHYDAPRLAERVKSFETTAVRN